MYDNGRYYTVFEENKASVISSTGIFQNKRKYRTDASITPPSSKAPPPSFEPISELAMHASISPPQNVNV